MKSYLAFLPLILLAFTKPHAPVFKMDIRNEKGISVVYQKDNKWKMDSVKLAEAEDLIMVLSKSEGAASEELEVRGVSELLIIRRGAGSNFGSIQKGSMKEIFPLLKKMRKGDTITLNHISYTEPGPKYRMLKEKGFAFVIQ